MANEPRRQFWIEAGIVGFFCLCFAFLVISHSRSASATHDEGWHLIAGYTYWLWNDYRMSPDHPPFIRKFAALPLLWMKPWPSPDDLASPNPSTSLRLFVNSWRMGMVRAEGCWGVSQIMLYGVRDETLQRYGAKNQFQLPTTVRFEKSDFFNDADRILFWGRMPILVLGLFLCLLVFSWARELYGFAGGILALAFCCFDPNIIAHSTLVTADIGATAFMFGAVYCFWRTCRQLTWVNVLLTALCFGLANASKLSAVLLLPIFAALAAIRIVSSQPWPSTLSRRFQPSTLASRTVAVSRIAAVIALVAYLALWTVYGFRYSAAHDPAEAAKLEGPDNPALRWPHEPGHFPIEYAVRQSAAIQYLLRHRTKEEAEAGFSLAEIEQAMPTAPLGLTGRLLLLAQRIHLLPEAYLRGFAGMSGSERRMSYLNGQYSKDGFGSYFLWTFLLKTPLVTLAAIGAAVFLALRRADGRWDAAFLLVPAGLFFAMCVGSRLNIGHRHILPIYPFLFVVCGGMAVVWAQGRLQTRRWTATVALAAVVISSMVVFAPPWKPAIVYPHFLAYFNELAGGPRNGYKRLVDSNLDWGQDLRNLKSWLDGRGVTEPINLCYFGVADPRFYGYPHLHLPGTFDNAPQVPFEQAQIPGYLALSATHRQGLYFNEAGRAQWQKFLEKGRLVDTIGYSIFIYRIESP